MATARPVGDPGFEDLTARARIRDAALRLFAERGIEATSVRDIAAAAGVSPGLIRHHFGSKAALRDACDAYAMEQVDRLRADMFDRGGISDPTFLGAVQPAARLLQSYLTRSLMDGSETAIARFDEMVDIGERWMLDHGMGTKARDPRAMTAVIALMKLGVFVMQDHLSRVLDVDMNTTAGYIRMLRGFVDMSTQPMLTTEQADQLHAALDRLESDGERHRTASDTVQHEDHGAEGAGTDDGAEGAA
ncbi:TetR family transcriptional regulator [Plantactinospora siamensis]|uniref:TetR family transcriptional regulator n=1 Tax=Plantactinospora siamensis TaxID=555372 RepID=A0ABV6NTE4_9ACTN